MRYCEPVVSGQFIKRPNRFIAHILIDGQAQICHVKNTGRCRELLQHGATVYCADCQSPTRKTRYDLIAVEKGSRLINMDSQAPNKAVEEWLRCGGFGDISQLKPESTIGNSRFDFSFQKDGRLCYMEVKGVTLEHDGVCAFPDAPTQRGVKHLKELAELAAQGYGAYVLFVIQMADVKHLIPNDQTDPMFGQALRQAEQAGVTIMAMDCTVTPESMTLRKPVTVKL